MAIEDGGDGHFVATQFFGDGFECELLIGLGFEQSCRLDWEAVRKGALNQLACNVNLRKICLRLGLRRLPLLPDWFNSRLSCMLCKGIE